MENSDQEQSLARDVGYVLSSSLYTVVYLISIYMFIRRRDHQIIGKRGWKLSVFQSSWGTLHLLVTCINAAGFLSCYVEYFTGSLLLVFWAAPYIIRSLYLWREYGKNLFLLQLKSNDSSKPPRMLWLIQKKWIYSDFLKKALFSLWIISNFIIVFGIYIGSKEYLNDPNPPPNSSCYGGQFIFMMIQAFFIVILGILCTWISWDVKDAFFFKAELTGIVVVAIPLLLIFGVSMATDLFPYYDSPTVIMIVSISAFYTITILFPLVMTYHVPRFQDISKAVEKRRSRAYSTNSTNFEDDPLSIYLDDPVLFNSLKEYAVKSWCVESLLFYIETRDYRLCTPFEKLPEKMKTIWNEFLDPNAFYLVNIDDQIMEKIRQGYQHYLEQENEGNYEPSRDLFKAAEKQVFEMLKFGPLKSWRDSPEFKALNNKTNPKSNNLQTMV